MRWRLVLFLNRHFGWHYILYKPTFSGYSLKRVRALPNGRLFVRWNFGFRFLDEYEARSDRDDFVIPLTFSWDKMPALKSTSYTETHTVH